MSNFYRRVCDCENIKIWRIDVQMLSICGISEKTSKEPQSKSQWKPEAMIRYDKIPTSDEVKLNHLLCDLQWLTFSDRIFLFRNSLNEDEKKFETLTATGWTLSSSVH